MELIDLRNNEEIELCKLRKTDDLLKRLPLTNVVLEPKCNGQRYSLQLGALGTWMVSRSKHDKTKGVDASSGNKFVVIEPEDWMFDISKKIGDRVVLIDGEKEVFGSESTASDVSRDDTPKQFTAFDILHADGKDWTTLALNWRMPELKALIDWIDHPRLKLISRRLFPVFDEENLEATLDVIRETKVEGFVLKELNRAYEKNWYGWKIKVEDTEDGFVIAANYEKKHSLGDVTKTDRVGSVALAQWFTTSSREKRSKLIAWVPMPKVGRPLMSEWREKLGGRVMEFKHRGWDVAADRFAFPGFIRWRDGEKSADQCLGKDEYA